MTENDPTGTPDTRPRPVQDAKKVGEFVDKASSAVESVSTVFNTIKWVCIALVVSIFTFIGYKAVQIVSKPAAAVGDAMGGVTDAVKTGTNAVKDSTSDLYSRLVIPTPDTVKFNTLSETAFEALNNMSASKPESMKDRMFRATNLGGNEGQVCRLDIDFGNGEVPVYLASDNEAYTTSKALGSKENRLIRMIIIAGKDDVSFNTSWDSETENWILKWKATTVKKPVTDELAASRAKALLTEAAKTCR